MVDLVELCDLGMPDFRCGWHDRAWWGLRDMDVPFPAPENDNGDEDVDEFTVHPWDKPLTAGQMATRNRPVTVLKNRIEQT